jgi:two-component system CheB/CheR fusion protein
MSQQPDQRRLLDILLANATEHALLLLDTKGRITAWLAGSEIVFGYSAAEVLGQPFSMLFTPEDAAKGVALGELEIAKHGAPAENDRWMLRKDGVRFWATGVLQALRDKGELLGFGKILRNRTDLKGMLEALENKIEQLQTDKQRRDNFVGVLGHELRGPLQSMYVAADILKPLAKDHEDGRFAIDVLRRQCDAINRLVEDLLDVTRLRTGKLKLELADIALADVLRMAVDACRPNLMEPVDFHLIVASEPLVVHADGVRLQQVFVNLIENAAKSVPDGGSIWVKMFAESREAVVKIEDTGVGISPELLPKIFDLFAQAESQPSKAADGLGIGLSVVKEIVALHAGSVQVRSDGIGKGSEFVVRLPLSGGDHERPDSPDRVRNGT